MPTPQGVYQPSFGAGELSEELWGRVDLTRYKTGAALLKNFFVSYQGGAISRPGTQFLDYAQSDDKRVRLVPFLFSSDPQQSFMLEFSDLAVRIWRDGALVVDGSDAVIVVVTPYTAASLKDLSFSQAGDVMTITSRAYAPRNLQRVSATSWTLSSALTFGSSLSPPGGVTVANHHNITDPDENVKFSYIVTAIDEAGDETRASDRGTIDDAVNITAVEGTNEISWNERVGATYYNVYRANPAVNSPLPGSSPHGFIGSVQGLSMVDTNIIPDFTRTPPRGQGIAFGSTDNYPAVSVYYQQRKVFASTNLAPQTLWGTKPGNFRNMDAGLPVNAGDAFALTLASSKVNAIQWLANAQGSLVAGTNGAIWTIDGGAAGAPLTPLSNRADPIIEVGSAAIPPLIINYDLLYVEANGGAVSTILYNQSGGASKVGQQLSVLASHLFRDQFGKNREIKEWAWARTPHNVVWAVTTDGALLSFTFLREQEVFAWAQHSTSGRFESVAVVPENGRDTVYFVVRRMRSNGSAEFEQRRMVERFVPRDNWELAEDAFAVDCGLTTALTYPDVDVEIENATGSGVGATFVLKSRVATPFVSGDVNKVIRLGGGIGRVSQFISSSRIRVEITTAIPLLDSDIVDFPVSSGNWSMTAKFTTVSGLTHLRGRTVKVVADGEVVADQVVGAGGSLTLSTAASRVTIGLPFVCKLQTLPLDVKEGSIQGRRRRVHAVTAKVYKTRGVTIGPNFTRMEELDRKFPVVPVTELFDGDWRTTVPAIIDTAGQVCVQQARPLPATILSITPEVDVGDDA